MATHTLRTPTVVFENVSKQFGDLRAVDNVSFHINSGEVVGFVGPNGAGKTTAISLLLGFLGASEGSIYISGSREPITPASAHRYTPGIGFVAGDMSLYDNLSGQQYLDFLLRRYKGSQSLQHDLLRQLTPRMDAKIKTLSRGNKQKIALVGALQHNPPLLVLDEPTSGLDPLMQTTFLSIIGQHAAKGATVFMSSHILSEVASACSRILFMRDGKIIIDKDTADIERESGKRVTLSAPTRTIKLMKRQLPADAHLIGATAKSLQFSYHGDAAELVQWLGDHPLSDLSIEERSLDDIFTDMYRNDTRGSS